MLLAACDDVPTTGSATLTPQEIHDNCVLLFTAGFDTASSALTWWIGLMATHPDVMEQLRREMDSANPGTSPIESIARLPYLNATIKIGRAHVCTPVTNAHLVCRLLLEQKK